MQNRHSQGNGIVHKDPRASTSVATAARCEPLAYVNVHKRPHAQSFLRSHVRVLSLPYIPCVLQPSTLQLPVCKPVGVGGGGGGGGWASRGLSLSAGPQQGGTKRLTMQATAGLASPTAWCQIPCGARSRPPVTPWNKSKRSHRLKICLRPKNPKHRYALGTVSDKILILDNGKRNSVLVLLCLQWLTPKKKKKGKKKKKKKARPNRLDQPPDVFLSVIGPDLKITLAVEAMAHAHETCLSSTFFLSYLSPGLWVLFLPSRCLSAEFGVIGVRLPALPVSWVSWVSYFSIFLHTTQGWVWGHTTEL